MIIDEGKAGPGVVPYLPLPELQKRQAQPGAHRRPREPASDGWVRTIVIVAIIALFYCRLFIALHRRRAREALVIRFGEIQRMVTEPGLYFKLPLVDELIPIEERLVNFRESPTRPSR